MEEPKKFSFDCCQVALKGTNNMLPLNQLFYIRHYPGTTLGWTGRLTPPGVKLDDWLGKAE